MNLTLPVKYDLYHTHFSANYYMEYLTFTIRSKTVKHSLTFQEETFDM